MKTAEENKKYACKDVEKNFHLYLDDQLSADEKCLFEEHLDNCLPCDKKIDFETKLKSMLKIKSKEERYPKELEDELRKIISSEFD
ncbi:zf-HC2 domain-containing protein [Calditrichota bacterium]